MEASPRPRTNERAGHVVSHIEQIVSAMLECLIADGKTLVIELKSRSSNPAAMRSNPSTAASRGASSSCTRIKFPGRSEREARKFAAVLEVMRAIHESLVSGMVITKRDIYYRDPDLFGKQQTVDRYVDDLAFTFGVSRGHLNVIAAAKGLVAGSLTISKADGTVGDVSTEPDGVLIPHLHDGDQVSCVGANWILVIEKEAVFRNLISFEYYSTSRAGRGVIVTAKGYPDIATRKFVQHVSEHHPHLPIYGLFDYDPDGISIMSTYKHGSMALAHEGLAVTLPALNWLGIKSRDFVPIDGGHDPQGLIFMTARDRRKASRMLEHEILQADRESEWRRELQVMLMLGYKAEIQILGPGLLETYLDEHVLIEEVDGMEIVHL